MLYLWDLLGVFVGAVSGAMAGRRKDMDWFGMYVVGLLSGIGGGTLRSMLIGDLPPPVFKDPAYGIVAAVATVVAWFGEPLWKRMRRVVSVIDAISIGVFLSIGVRVSQAHGLAWWACVGLGVITATFGGVLRDIARAEVPLIFRKEIYATACFVGGLALLGFDAAGLNSQLGFCLATMLVTMIRLLAIRYALNRSEP